MIVSNYSTELRYNSKDGPVMWFLDSLGSLNGKRVVVPMFEILNLGDGRRIQSLCLSDYYRSACVCITSSAVKTTCSTNVSRLPHISRGSIVFLLHFCRIFVALLSHSCRTFVALTINSRNARGGVQYHDQSL